MKKTPTATPHDALFKTFLKYPATARDFIEIHLPPTLRSLCDLATLELQPASFIEENLRAYYSDVLWSMKTSEGHGYIYVVIEHQSRPDVHMADVMDEMEQLNVTYTVEEQLAEKELMETINRFLEEMSPKDRYIFVRRYWFLDPVSAISKRHHMSVGSVKMNLYRNRKKLLKLLEKEGGRI